jgi:ATP synthase protein I
MKQKPPPTSVLGLLGSLSGLGFTIAIPIVLGTVVGNYLDRQFHTQALFTLLGLLLGLAAGIIGAYRLLKVFLQTDSRDRT